MGHKSISVVYGSDGSIVKESVNAVKYT